MNIEELIKKRKQHLDIEKAPPEIWNNIHKQWKEPTADRHLWWKIAAAIFIASTIVLLGQNIFLQNKVDELASLGDISENYAKIEANYQVEIRKIEATLSINEVKQQENFKWLFEELEMLEQVNNIYRKDIGKTNEDQLVSVLIDYYEKKLRLLRKLELEIKRTNKLNNNEETNTNSISM